jgi:hypothetical protein
MIQIAMPKVEWSGPRPATLDGGILTSAERRTGKMSS